MIVVTKHHTMGFPSIAVKSEHYDLTVIPGIGGRIMEFGNDGLNLLYQNHNLAGYVPQYEATSAAEMRDIRQRGNILLYGGEKTWLAPQRDWVDNPYADLDHGAYDWEVLRSEQAIRLVLTSKVCRETQLQIIRTITCFNGERFIDIEHKLINHGTVPVTKGLWQVTMLNRNGTAEIPGGSEKCTPDAVDMLNGHLATVERHAKGWRMDMKDDRQYKLGFMTDAGHASALYRADNGKTYRLRKSFRVEPEKPYPHQTVVEVYNASDFPYYELEVHSPAYTLQPGESAAFVTRWELIVSGEQ